MLLFVLELTVCLEASCENGGMCIHNVSAPNSFTCDCPSEYSGLLCEIGESTDPLIYISIGMPPS